MSELLFPLQLKRQYNASLDPDLVFSTIADKNSYLTNAVRYSGMIVSCLEEEGKIFVLNNVKDTWLEVSGSGSSASIDDTLASLTTTYSSEKINTLIQAISGGTTVEPVEDVALADLQDTYDVVEHVVGNKSLIIFVEGVKLSYNDFTDVDSTHIKLTTDIASSVVKDMIISSILLTSGGGSSTASAVSYTDNGVTTVDSAIDKLFDMLYVNPSVTSMSHNIGVVERGVAISDIILNWTLNKEVTTQTLTDVGSIDTSLRTYTIVGANISDNKTYTLTINDGKNSGSGNCTVEFVNPFYYGVGVSNLTTTQIKGLTKSIKTKSDTNVTSSPVSEVFYFAYDKAYGFLSDIKDSNGFSIVSDYKIRDEQIIGLDGIAHSYYIYEGLNTLYMSDFTVTYKF